MAPEDNNCDVEAIVMKTLSYTSPVPEKDAKPSSYDRSQKRTPKSSRRKSSTANASLSSDMSKYRERVAEVAKHTEQRALRLALIHPNAHRKQSLRLKGPSNDSAVIQAPDIKEHAPKRRPRSQKGEISDSISANADAAEIVEKYRREVGRFGSTALHKRDRKMYETAELVKLGCRQPKNEKMPIGMLVKKRKYQKIREQKKREMDLATGMLVRTTRK